MNIIIIKFIIIYYCIFSQLPVYGEPIKIGFIATLSGSRASMGQDALRGAQLALGELQPGLVELVVEDSRGDPREGMNCYKRLLASGLRVVLTQNSNVSLPISRSVNRDGIVQIAFNTTADSYSTPKDLTFRINGTTRDEAEKIGELVMTSVATNSEKIGLVVMDDEYPENLGRNFRRYLSNSGNKPVVDESFLPGEVDFRAIIARLKKNRVTRIVLLSYQVEAGRFVRQAGELGLRKKFLVTNTPANNPEFFDVAGEYAKGVTIVFHKVDRSHPAFSRFKEEHGYDPTWFAANGYDAVKLVAEIARSCSTNFVPDCIVGRLAPGQQLQGLGGVKEFDVNGDMRDWYQAIVG